MKFVFQDVPVYIKAKEFYKEIKALLKENKQDKFISDQLSRASLNECVACLDLIFDSAIPKELLEMATELGKMLSGMVKAFS